MTINELLVSGKRLLRENNIDDYAIIAKLLLASILDCKKEELLINYEKEVLDEKKQEFFNDLERIANGYPLQYLTGKQEFMKMNFFVNESVLIPRADTEVLVEEVIAVGSGKRDILELCTGSGCIAISLAKNMKNAKIIATDISESALNVAKRNSDVLLDNDVIEFKKSDIFENVYGEFDIIVSNPPYIKRDIIKDYNLKYEPSLALDGGEDGLEFYRVIINEGHKYLKENRFYST